jgi:hypothetical protein
MLNDRTLLAAAIIGVLVLAAAAAIGVVWLRAMKAKRFRSSNYTKVRPWWARR